MNALGWLILGLLAGWAVEFAIDFFYWRKKARVEAEALVQQEAVLLAQKTEFGHRQAAQRLREKELADLQASLASRDADLLQQARRIEERSDDLSLLEQRTEKRRAELDRIGMTLGEREKDIASRNDQLKSKEADYGRRLNALEATEQELARRIAVVSNREEAMQSWEGRILSREHDVADREASVNYHAGRVAADAAAFDASRHLLQQLYRTPAGKDNLQALVGIDQKIADLLADAGIRSFERLAETSLGELTRIVEAAGPRFALANPLSWAEQAACWIQADYVALDRLQCELLGIEREPVAEPLFAEMTRPRGKQSSPAAPDAAAVPVAAVPAAATAEAVAPGPDSPKAPEPDSAVEPSHAGAVKASAGPVSAPLSATPDAGAGLAEDAALAPAGTGDSLAAVDRGTSANSEETPSQDAGSAPAGRAETGQGGTLHPAGQNSPQAPVVQRVEIEEVAEADLPPGWGRHSPDNDLPEDARMVLKADTSAADELLSLAADTDSPSGADVPPAQSRDPGGR